MSRYRQLWLALALVIPFITSGALHADTKPPNQRSDWYTSWMSSVQPTWDGNFSLPTKLPFQLRDQTLRQIFRSSIGGDNARIILSNRYGTQPLVIGAASLATVTHNGKIDPESSVTLTFSGETQVTIPPGADVISDALNQKIADLTPLALDLYLPEPTTPSTFHWDGIQTSYLATGDQTGSQTLTSASELDVKLFVQALLISSDKPIKTLVALGDSITDGNASTPNTYNRWTDHLNNLLVKDHIAIINAGISGAQLVNSKMGDNALARLNRDLLSLPNVDSVLVMLGINDIGWPGTLHAPDASKADLSEMELVYRQLASRARIQGVRVIASTLTPFAGALENTYVKDYYSSAKEQQRQTFNQWLREDAPVDLVIDFDKLMQDPAYPQRLRKIYRSDDFLHPNDTGYRAMADYLATQPLFTQQEATQ